jgi:hypothetical protein
LRCGCAFAADPQPHAEPLICCAEARALDATARLADAFAADASPIWLVWTGRCCGGSLAANEYVGNHGSC